MVAAGVLAALPLAAAGAEFRLPLALAEQGARVSALSGPRTDDPERLIRREPASNQSYSYGVTDFWRTELGGEWHRDEEDAVQFGAVRWNNTFQMKPLAPLLPLQLATRVEYAGAAVTGYADALQLGGGLSTWLMGGEHALDLSLSPELGRLTPQGAAIGYAARSRWTLAPSLSVGLDLSGEPGQLGELRSLAEQTHRAGAGVSGGYRHERWGRIGYEVGYLVGLTPVSDQPVANGQITYKLRF